jgi:hypothetical protein
MFDLSNREISIIILFVILFFYITIKDKGIFIKSFKNVAKSFFTPKIILPILLLAGYSTAILVLINDIFGIAGISIKNIILWFVFTAIVLLFSLTNISKDQHFFKNLIIKNVTILAFLEYALNIYSFGLIVELFLQSSITILVMLSFVAGRENKYKKVNNIFNFLLTFLLLMIVFKTIQGILTNLNHALLVDFLLNFIIPIILTLSIIPFLYIVAVFMHYETLFKRLPFLLNLNRSEKINFSTKKKIIYKYGLNLRKLINIKNEDLYIVCK